MPPAPYATRRWLPFRIGSSSTTSMPVRTARMSYGLTSWSWSRVHLHRVYLDTFYIDQYEVTNRLYRRFVEVTGHREPVYWDDSALNGPDWPVVGVSWEDARAYCE
ncbi:MAG: hypothetical protein D6736_08170 [Nitrospinota bacterium]|nr:MAG: hypothetical protein D6736_08170 [Nitrospinota bacterium]